MENKEQICISELWFKIFLILLFVMLIISCDLLYFELQNEKAYNSLYDDYTRIINKYNCLACEYNIQNGCFADNNGCNSCKIILGDK